MVPSALFLLAGFCEEETTTFLQTHALEEHPLARLEVPEPPHSEKEALAYGKAGNLVAMDFPLRKSSLGPSGKSEFLKSSKSKDPTSAMKGAPIVQLGELFRFDWE